MKTLTPLFALLIMTSTAFANPIWTRVVDHSYFNKSEKTDMTLVNDSIILVTGNVETFGCFSNRLFAFDSNGELLWYKFNNTGYNLGGGYDLVSARDGFIYTTGFAYADDYTTGEEPLIIVKLDAEGNEQFVTHYRNDDWDTFIFYPVSIDVNQNGELLIAGGEINNPNKLIRVDNTGTVVWENTYDMIIKQAVFSDVGGIVIREDLALSLADNAGAISESVTLEQSSVDMLIWNNHIYLLASSSLKVFDFNLEPVEVLLESDDVDLMTIKVFDDELWIMGEKDDELVLMRIENHKDHHQINFSRYVDDPGFVVTQDKVIFAGNSPSGQIGLYACAADQENSTAYQWPDVEILDFTISNITINYQSWGEESYATDFDFDAELLIRNNGTETLTALSVLSLRSGGANCVRQFYYSNFPELEIAPGAEFTLQMARSNEFAPPSPGNTLCFELLAPNSSLELNIENNLLCKSFNITSIEEVSVKSPLYLYPNPASDQLHIKTAIERPVQLVIMDISGKLILTKQYHSVNTSIDVSALLPGVYLLQLTDGSQIWNGRFVKE